METTNVSITKRKFVNRGFFLGPYCPIYGTGGILLLTINKYQKEPIVVFILSIVICSIVEYLTSYFLELIYRIRWWDYSNRTFNINGRICLFNAICFGLLGVLSVCFLNPYFIKLIGSLNNNILFIITLLLLLFTTTDIIITFITMFDIRNTIINLKDKTLTNLFKPNRDSTEEISRKVKNMIKDKTIIHKHLTKTYANFKIYKNNFFKHKNEIFKLREKLENRYVIASFIGIVVGYILGSIFNNIGLYIVICFVLGIVIIHLINRGNNGK